VLALVRRLADSGVAVVIISHNLADVFEVADYINVLYLGAMVAQLSAKETSYNEVVAYITGIKGDTSAAEEVEEEEVVS
jgi:D-xylose transport system ATP-binding protein